MGSSGELRPQDRPARPGHGRHEAGEAGRRESSNGRGWDPGAATALAAVAAVFAVALTAFAPRRTVVSWSLVLTITAAAFVSVHRGSRKGAEELGIRVLQARRLIAVVVFVAGMITLGLYGYFVRQEQTAVRRHTELILGVGLHADLDSKDANWDQGISGYEGDVYFDTGRKAHRTPRIQGGLIGEDRWTRVVFLGNGFEVNRRTCIDKLRANPEQNMPVDRLRPGYQFCAETNKGRWAFLTLIGQPNPQRLRLDVVVWEHQEPTAVGVLP